MTKRQVDRMIRTIERLRAQVIHLTQELDDYARPGISPAAVDLEAASDRLFGAMRELESVRDDMDLPVPDEADRVS